MQLFQIFLPLFKEHGVRFPRSMYETIESELVEQFTGYTAYSQSPASGLWKDDRSRLQSDELVIYEVMTEEKDLSWWTSYRRTLEDRFKQDQILIRSQLIEIVE